MSNGYLDLLSEDGLPKQVSNKILLGVLKEIWQQMNLQDQQREELIKKMDGIIEQLHDLKHRVRAIEESNERAPSLLWLLQTRPKETIKTIAIIVFVMLFVLAISDPLRALIMGILGVAP